MTRQQKYILVAIALILLIGTAIWAVLKSNTLDAQEVEVITSLVDKQAKLEKDFQNTNYRLAEPKIVVNPYEISPLTALVLFNTDKEEPVEVTIQGKDELSTFKHQFPAATSHRLPIHGLYADTENKVTLKTPSASHEITIKTDPLPDNFQKVVSVKNDKAKLTNSLYFLTSSAATAHTSGYDVNGDLRWYLTEDLIWEIKRNQNGKMYLSTERLIYQPYYTTGIYEIDLLGKIYTEFSFEGGYHHDYHELANGNLIIASDDFKSNAGTVEDIIIELNPKTGEIVKTIDLKDILPVDQGKSIAWITFDWFHNNSVDYDPKTDSLILSGRHQDAVININYTSGKLNYIIGSPEDWGPEWQKYLLKSTGDGPFEWQWEQHAATFLPNGDILLFDNGNNKTKDRTKIIPAERSYSRAVIYRVDAAKKTIRQVWQYGKQRGSSYYSPFISDADYLGRDQVLVHSGGVNYKDGKVTDFPAGVVGADKLRSFTTEILDDKLVFELELDTNFYRAEKMPVYTDQDKQLALGAAKQIGDLGTTSTTDLPGVDVSTAIPAKDESKANRQFWLKREYDRLVLSGNFKQGENVHLILQQFDQLKTYKVPVSKKPYTALCVDIFTEEETENGIPIIFYVNQKGLVGKYNIFVKIDNQIYNTKQFVNF